MKTRLLGVLAVLLPVLLSMSLGERAIAASTVTLRWGIYADPSRYQVAQAQAAAFHKLYPNINVEVQQVPFAEYYQKLGTQLAAGTAYDVMMMSGSYFPKIAPQGGLMDLSPMVAKDHLNMNQYTKEKDDSVSGGKTYALPYELDIQALYYNKTDFRAAKVAFPTSKWTWTGLLHAAQKLTRTINGKKVWGILSDDLYPSWVSFIGQAGGSVFKKDERTPTIDTPQVKRALTFMTDLIHKYHVSPGPGDIPTGVNAFQAGLVAMQVDGSYSVLPTLQTAKFDWDVAPLPRDKKRAVAYWTQGIAIANSTKYPKESWLLAKFLVGKQAEGIMARTKFSTPSIKSVAKSRAYLSGKPAHIKVFIDGFKNADPVPFNDKWFDVMAGPNSAMGKPFSLLWLGKISVNQAVAQAQAAVKQVMAGP